MGYTTIGSGGGSVGKYMLAESAARTATLTTADQNVGGDATAIHVVMNATASASTPSVVPKIQGKSANGDYYDLLVGSAVTGTGTQVLKLGPGIGQVANGAAADVLPATWRVVCTAGDSDSLTYSLAVELFS